jgi:hypothetical protein
VLYDLLPDRWLISQRPIGEFSGPDGACIAIAQTVAAGSRVFSPAAAADEFCGFFSAGTA